MTDSDPTPDILLANLDWARHLARALVRDEAGADDLVQDAWLRTRSHPVRGQHPADAESRRWLGRVLRNLARDSRRMAKRRREREAAAARAESSVTDDELGERVARQETLGRWVLELDEPYRRTMLLRWFDGQSAADIAASEDVSPATVRTRLRRGAALLRDRAERESAGDGRGWLAGLAGLPLESTPAPLSSSAALTLALFTMNAKLFALLVVAVLGVAAWILLPSREMLPSSTPGPSAPSTVGDGLGDPDGEAWTAEVESSAGREVAAIEPSTDLDPTTPTAPVPTEPDRDLVVRVIGADGEPAIGAPVVVVRGRVGDEELVLSATSEAPGGLATFRDFVGTQERSGGSPSVLTSVGLDVIGFDPPRVALPGSGLPDVPPVLSIPPHGELVVRLVGRDGSPFPVSEHIGVTPLGAVDEAGRSPERGDRRSVFIREASEARFPMVAPGTRLWVQVRPSGVLADVEQVLAPLTAGERRVVELVMGAKDAHVTGRVVHPDGRPVAISSFDVDFESAGSAVVYEVGADGSFVLPLDRLRTDEGFFTGRIEAQQRTNVGPRAQVEVLTGTFQAPVPRAGEGHDVGTVVLRGAPTIAAGRVVDETGAAVEGAAIGLYEKINQREDPETFDWSFAGVNYAYTGSEGRFELKGNVEPGEYALRVDFVDWIDRGAHRFQAGERGIELVVDRKRALSGRLVLPKGVDMTQLEVRAREEGASRERRAYASWSSAVDAGGRFTIAALRPMPVTLSVHLQGWTEPLAEKPGVVPRLEDEGPAPALDPWDLSGDVERLSFGVFLASGEPMEDGFVALGPLVLEHRGGRVAVLVPAHGADELLVFAPGHVPARVSIAPGLERIDLVRGARVVVSLDQPLPDPPEGVFVELCLTPEDPAWALPVGTRSFGSYRSPSGFGSEQVRCQPGETSWELHGAGAGLYRPRWILIAPGNDPLDSAARAFFTTPTGRYEIELGPDGTSATYTATYDQDDWDKELRRVLADRR